MVPSDWDLAPKCVCGPNFIFYHSFFLRFGRPKPITFESTRQFQETLRGVGQHIRQFIAPEDWAAA